MSTGDQNDMAWRLGKVLPARWFPDPANAPVLQAVLQGLGAGWAAIYSQVTFTGLQTRVATATGGFLDMAALDYLAGSLPRRAGEPDGSFRSRITKEVIRPRLTRAGVVQVLTDMTGRAPIIIEPARATDTGGIGSLGMTKGTGIAIANSSGTAPGAGAIGSIALHNQVIVHAYRATGGGIAKVGGIRALSGTGWAGGGIASISNPGAAGAIEIANLSMSLGQITDADIFKATASVMPAGGIAWVAISN